MSSVRVKTTYNTEGPHGTTEEHSIYANHNNSSDYVTYYDENGDIILVVPDTIDNNILDAIMKLYVPQTYKDNQVRLKDGIEHMTKEDRKICNL